MDLNKLSSEAHGMAVEHGFWEDEHSNEHCLCLVISEIAEAVEADRKNRHFDVSGYELAMEPLERIDRDWMGRKMKKMVQTDHVTAFKAYMKDTVEDEMADVVIRLADMAGDQMVDFDKLAPSNYYRAFGRWSFTENAFALMKGLSRENTNINRRIQFGIKYMFDWAESLGFDLEYSIREKMKFNATRGVRHGKAY